MKQPISPGCTCQRAATCRTPLPAPWKHHQLQHKEMTQAITTFISTEETEVPPAHQLKKVPHREEESPAAHQCLRISPLGPQSPQSFVSQGEQRGCPGQRPMLYFSGLADSVLRRNQGHETPVTELSATLKSAGPQWKLPCPTL